MSDLSNIKPPQNATAVIVTAAGEVLWGYGIGAQTSQTGEICFNTSMSGYQEILTDPSYAGQIINFTFPHIGNVGTNEEDLEANKPAARGLILREAITNPSNWRATDHLNKWLSDNKLPGITGLDTRALTREIRDNGPPKAVICHDMKAKFDLNELQKVAQEWPGLEGMDLAKEVSCTSPYVWDQMLWDLDNGYQNNESNKGTIVVMDFGVKQNILRCLASTGYKIQVVPANTNAKDIMAHKPSGIFLSNGPGDPSATGEYAVPVIQELLQTTIPVFGICLGHQILALALGGKTKKMRLGHRGANHPVKDLTTSLVEITSQNHGFEVIGESLPDNVTTTHVSLFDGSNEGIALKDKPVFSVQYHPEASPGPHDSHYLFDRFVSAIEDAA